MMEKQIGPADHIYRVSFFDIKSDIPSPYAKWLRDSHSVIVYLGLKNNRYYTSLVVESKNIQDIAKRRKKIEQ